MSEVRIEHKTTLSRDEVREKVQGIMGKVEEKFALEGGWTGDIYTFKRSGLDGRAEILDGKVTVVITLGLVLSVLRKTIESELRSRLEKGLP